LIFQLRNRGELVQSRADGSAICSNPGTPIQPTIASVVKPSLA